MSVSPEHITKNLRWVTMSALNRLDIDNLNKYEKYEQVAIEYYAENVKGFSQAKGIKVWYGKMNAHKQVFFPNDYLTYTKIAVVRNGKIFTLTLNNSIALPPDAAICNDSIEQMFTSPQPSYAVSIVPHFDVSGVYQPLLYSIGGGVNENYYRVHDEQRMIQFDIHFPETQILVEYISNGNEINGDTIPYPEWVPAIREVICEKFYASPKSANPNMIRYHRLEKEEFETKAKMMKGRNPYEIMDIFYKNQGLKL